MKKFLTPLELWVALPCLLSILLARPVMGQGTINPIVLHTGSGNVILSDSLSYTNTASSPFGPNLVLDLGFATEEQPLPGFIADSYTVSITGPNGTIYLVTFDAGGPQWAPTVSGAVPISESSIQRLTTAFLVADEGLTNKMSYTVSYALPANFQSVPLSVNFDLFDNQDALRSLGYRRVMIPEPSVAALLLLGLFCARQTRRLREFQLTSE